MVLETDSDRQRRQTRVIPRTVPFVISDRAGLENLGRSFQGFFHNASEAVGTAADVDFEREKHQLAVENQQQALKAARDFDLDEIDETLMDDWDYAQVIERKQLNRDLDEEEQAGLAFGTLPDSDLTGLDGRSYTFAKAARYAMAERDASSLQTDFLLALAEEQPQDPQAFAAAFYEERIGNGAGDDVYDALHRQRFFRGVETAIISQSRQNAKNALNGLQSIVANNIAQSVNSDYGITEGDFVANVQQVKATFGGDQLAATNWVVQTMIQTALDAGRNGDPDAVHRTLAFLESGRMGPEGQTLDEMMPGVRDQAIADLNESWHKAWTKQGNDALAGFSQQLAEIEGANDPSPETLSRLTALMTNLQRASGRFGMVSQFDTLMSKAAETYGEIAQVAADMNVYGRDVANADPDQSLALPDERFKNMFDVVLSRVPNWQEDPEQAAALGAALQNVPRVHSAFRKTLSTALKQGNTRAFRLLQVAMQKGTGNLSNFVDSDGAKMYHLFRGQEMLGKDVTTLAQKINDDPDFMSKFSSYSMSDALQEEDGRSLAEKRDGFYSELMDDAFDEDDVFITPSIKADLDASLRFYMYSTGNDLTTSKEAMAGLVGTNMDIYPSRGRYKLAARINGWTGPTLATTAVNPATAKPEQFAKNWELDQERWLEDRLGFDEDNIQLAPILRPYRREDGSLGNMSLYAVQDIQGEGVLFFPGQTYGEDVTLDQDPEAARKQLQELLPDRFVLREVDQAFMGLPERDGVMFELYYRPGFLSQDEIPKTFGELWLESRSKAAQRHADERDWYRRWVESKGTLPPPETPDSRRRKPRWRWTGKVEKPPEETP